MPGNIVHVQLDDGISAALREVDRAARSKALRAALEDAVAKALVDNFNNLDAARHRNEAGIRFYAGAAASVQRPQVDGDDVVVAATREGVAQRYYGGTITAGSNGSGAKWLTIPAIPAALGRRAGSFSNLKFVFFNDSLAALVSTDPNRATYRVSPRGKKERGAALVPREDGRLPVVY